jgi:hypothetical protein
MPDWLKAIGAPPSAGLAPTPVEPVATPPEAAVPDLSAMSEDDAMRWLESLAARQGADPAELTTTAEERAAFGTLPEAAPPEDVVIPECTLPEDTTQARSPLFIETAAEIEEPVGPLMPPTGTLPDIFGTEAVEAETPTLGAAMPDFSTLSDDAALRWLEGLAARQGADPAELTTTPEERPDRPPIWITAESETPLPAEDAPPPVMAESPAAAVPAAAQPPEPKLDEDEAMRWLESLAARPAPVAEELRSLVAEPGAAPRGRTSARARDRIA